MAWNGSGLFLRAYNWVSDAANGINITASRMDAEFDNFANGLSNAIAKDGQTTGAILSSPTINTPVINGTSTSSTLTNPPMTAATLQNSWANVAPWTCQYMKDLSGRVWVEGVISNGTVGVAAFTLPVGYRPAISINIPVFSTVSGVNTVGLLAVLTDGTCVPSTIGTTAINLNSISFRAA